MFDKHLSLSEVDPELYQAIQAEERRQEEHIELIASENYVSPAVLAAQGSQLTNKYAEGYPGKRYYGGCEYVDKAETLALERVKTLFGAAYANVQPHSGSQANAAVYMALMEPGDAFLGMDLSQGGHLTHGSKVNFSGKLYRPIAYGLDEKGFIDYQQVEALALEHKPKMILAGFSAYSRTVDWSIFREIADRVNAYFVVDMAHVAGLVAASVYPSPVSIADVTTSTTHKTLRDLVIEANHLTKSFEGRILFQDLSFNLPKGGILGIIGANGAGKSTLLKLITGQEKPDSGTLRLGDTVQLSYVDQSRDHLNAQKTVWEELSDGLDQIVVGAYQIPSRAYLGRFNFKGSDQQKFIGDLSGGERNRVHLAKMLKSGGNLLLLDEPTNDLDIETLRALEEALLTFPGSAVIVSHDRWFLDRVATHILAFEDDGTHTWFEGSFSEYEEDKIKRLGTDAVLPKRIKQRVAMIGG